ncbi:hypothetical protein KXX33_002988 [Aspergillus fumigatus]|uniref:Bubble protein n=1 Tax=Aspergillus fumigatus TaxID=746128 RepID=A0A9P8SR40_ASPFM|nr:hypothetical protein KXX30_004372 [Aspergillus fumigatus]KMK55430.1 Bubble protein [Aspergillus fumigatus Z5]KAH1305321.1 hypothetical protein KXX66_002895 [Aspergillus fumigatus]KAH1345394.1 hypothetical protein KXX33_002988 [Aspergillus fumigatus]KAH1439199.1 hypothetical protein KXX68_005247 [Aspergillus fumigatus]
MKFTALLCTLIAATAVSASTVPRDEFQIQDTCGSGYGGDQRRTNSPCKASNGDRHFCGCDRTGVVECRNGRWTEIQDCHASTCHGTNDGAARC